MVEIRTAERPAPGRLSEDRVFVLSNAVIVLDGVTSGRPPARNGGWYAQTLGQELLAQLAGGGADLADLLAAAIGNVNERHGLTADDSPATTVAIVRWTDREVDVLVLADSPVVVFGDSTHVIADTRIAALRPVVEDILSHKNRPGGYWVAEGDPRAAHQAIRKTLPRDAVQKVIIATDGVSCAVDEYRIFPSWQSVLELIAAAGLEAVLDEIRAAELTDPSRTRWPRAKIHDDQALAVIDLDGDQRH
ncbi:MAG: protein phosphatase 2C domain-containing protein [Umezawaea sp.]